MLQDKHKWAIDEIIIKYWDAKTAGKKRKVELECYKLFKKLNFIDGFIEYLKINEAKELADEMERFIDVYHKVSHEHEKKLAA